MKTMKGIRFGPALLGLLLFAATAASRTRSARVRRAAWWSVSTRWRPAPCNSHPKNGKAPTELALTNQTQFVHNWHFAPASELKDGTRAVVYYRTPFFGKPFVTKVVWVNGS
jgi:hypothetical protein